MPQSIVVAVTAALSGTQPATAPTYTLTTITGLQDQADTLARGIDNKGEVIGSEGRTEAYPPCQTGAAQGFTAINGKGTEFRVRGACYTIPMGIAHNGTIVGYEAPKDNEIGGFILSPEGHTTIYTYPGAYYTRFFGIDPLAITIVGCEYDGTQQFHGIIYKSGKVTTYDVPVPNSGTTVTAVNRPGDTVGNYYDSNNLLHGWSLVGGVFSVIDYPNAIVTNITGINRQGEIVGTYQDSEGNLHGFITGPAGKRFQRFDVPGAKETQLHGLDSNGDLVGSYTKGNATYAFSAVKN